MAASRFKHIFLKDWPYSYSYTSPKQARDRIKIIEKGDRQGHGTFLKRKLNEAWQQAEDECAVYRANRSGVYIEFISDEGADLVEKSLEDMKTKKVRLLNVRTEGEGEQKVTYATVYVAHEKKGHFLNKMEKYVSEDTSHGKPKNARLVNSIADLRKALLLESFWSDYKEFIPEEKDWCEVWLSSDSIEVLQRFEDLLRSKEIDSREGYIRFPERTVKVVLADRNDLEELSRSSDAIAEYRLAKETADFWLDMDTKDQAKWVEELLERTRFAEEPTVAVCILDTGINNGHPLIEPVLKDEDCHAVKADWGVNDHNKHGTLMAGVTAYGCLEECLSSSKIIQVNHCLESSKILPPLSSEEENRKELWGYITSQGVSRAEIQAPHRKRINCMAVTSTDTIDRGRPSSWSGMLDQLAAGVEEGSGTGEMNGLQRLFVVSAGNVSDWKIVDYPDTQLKESIQDPGQAWNVLTVGAYTELDQIKNPDLRNYKPVANAGDISPFTTSSLTWENKKWPNKPDIVMEGGNIAVDDLGNKDESDELSLLSTYYQPWLRYFYSINKTSAASARAAWFAAKILSIYPEIWLETVRALMVHSAQWTEAQKNRFIVSGNTGEYSSLLRSCGYGVPDLWRAIYSASNSLTLVSEEYIQPFYEKKKNYYANKEMHLYDLPWPKEVLRALPDDTEVQMRVTISYFIEPGPGEIGWQYRYRYPSHGLRFEVKRPLEAIETFQKRINKDMRDEEEGTYSGQGSSDKWVIGKNERNKGSLHSDIWKGYASELADTEAIAIYPTIGWWRTRPHLGKYDKQARYSLIVTITTPSEEVDIYTPVANKVGITTPTVIEI